MFERDPYVSGQFYPSNVNELNRMLSGFIDTTLEKYDAKILIVPHAGYVYSGSIAGKGFSSVKTDNIKHVILIGPSHHYPLSRPVISPYGKWNFPGGSLEVKEDIINEFLSYDKKGIFDSDTTPFIPEHSLEVELPFINYVFGDVDLIPIIVPHLQPDVYSALANIIVHFLNNHDDAFVVVSSDMYHGEDYEMAKKVNKDVSDVLHIGDPLNFMTYSYDMYTNENVHVACGESGIITAMYVAKNLGLKWKVISTTTSADVVGRYGGYVVGYLTAIAYKDERKKNFSINLSDEDKKQILRYVRDVIKSQFGKGEGIKLPDNPILNENMGVFVTLHKNGNLRGCIGYVVGFKPLKDGIKENAINAAFRDPRFQPLKEEELDSIDIEVTILSPLIRCNPEDIVVGRDGIFIKKGFYSGLLLPQVATEYNWDRETFLMHTCMKAGLTPDCYKDDVEIYRFEGYIFSEEDYGL